MHVNDLINDYCVCSEFEVVLLFGILSIPTITAWNCHGVSGCVFRILNSIWSKCPWDFHCLPSAVVVGNLILYVRAIPALI